MDGFCRRHFKMPPRKDFRSKRAFKVVSFKAGKAVKKQKINVPGRLNVQKTDASSFASNIDVTSDEQISQSAAEVDVDNFPADASVSTGSRKWPKFRIKKKLRAYHTRKSRLATSWLDFREQIVTALLSREAMPLGNCVIPGCTNDALGRCLDCGPAMYLCEEHIQVVHAGGKSLHKPQAWKVIDYSFLFHSLSNTLFFDFFLHWFSFKGICNCYLEKKTFLKYLKIFWKGQF